MGKKMNKVISLVLALVLIVSGMQVTGLAAQAAEADSAKQEYEIYPTPRDVSYGESELVLGDTANVVVESTIDEATVNRLNEVLAIKNIQGTVSEKVVSGTTNILVGTNGSGGAAESWVKANVAYAEDLFDQRDAYVLSIRDNVIAILGKDTDAAFYGLSTLKMIFNQTAEKNVRELKIEDYASGQYRGFIEGYYGIPWSVEDRISLMQFGGDFKMNIYIFAPKDDPYHNSQWRELYPKDKLEDIRKMVEAGQAAKCRFAWAIHPFMNDKITTDNYDESLEVIKAKFQQLYDVGVRQFVISADDASSSVQIHSRLCRDMSEWVKEHEGTYNLVFVPQVYCTSAVSWSYWGGSTVEQYFSYFKDITDLEIMWTGEWVCHPASQNTFDNFLEKAGREAFMWLNWPVNDVNHKRLVMGPGGTDILQKGLTNFKGIVTNPLEEAEASKTALFAIADFAWNTTDFDAEQSWADGFKYIDAGAPEALHELCKHMTNPSPGGITSMGESVELTPYINAFTSAYNANQDITEPGNALVEQLQKIVDAADDFQQNGTNENLKDEMKPWVDSLRYLAKAVIGYVRTAMAINVNDTENAWNNYVMAVNNYTASQSCEAPQLSGTTIVEAGAMKIMPLAATLNTSLKTKMNEILKNSFSGGSSIGGGEEPGEKKLIYSGIGGLYTTDTSSKLEHITDGNDATYAWFNDSVSAGAYIGFDLGDVYKLESVRILQGNAPTHGDIFSRGNLEYSLDGSNWTSVGVYTTNTIEVDLLSQNLKARYVRLRSETDTKKWYAIREFTVTTQPAVDYAYTNVESLEETVAAINKNDAAMNGLPLDITLKNGEYIGLEFPTVREVTDLTTDYTEKDKLTLEYSYNGVDWNTAEASEGMDAKWIRIINKGDADVSFTLNAFAITNSDANRSIFAEPEGKDGGEAVKAADNSLMTAFKASEGSGSLTCRLNASNADELFILADSSAVSDAKVSVRTETGEWKEAGKLTGGLNVFGDLVFCGSINEVKIEWQEAGPDIYEMYVTEAEKTAAEVLQDKVDGAEALDKALYTEESCKELEKAIADVKAVIENSAATPAELAAANDALTAALNNLKTKAEAELEEAKKAVSDAIGKANAIYADGPDKYTKESWEAFDAAYRAASDAADDADAATLKRLADALTEAQNALKKPVITPPDATEKKLQTPTIKSVKSSAAKSGVVVTVTVNPVAGADHYAIYRTVKGKTELAGNTASGKTFFKDTKAAGIKNIKSVSYSAVAVSKDTAVKASDKSAAANITFAAKTSLKKPVVSGKKIKLTWKKNKKAKGYAIYRSTKKSSGYKLIKKINKSKTVSYLDKGAKKKGTYYYKIVTIGKNQVSVMSSAKKVKRK